MLPSHRSHLTFSSAAPRAAADLYNTSERATFPLPGIPQPNHLVLLPASFHDCQHNSPSRPSPLHQSLQWLPAHQEYQPYCDHRPTLPTPLISTALLCPLVTGPPCCGQATPSPPTSGPAPGSFYREPCEHPGIVRHQGGALPSQSRC